MRDVLNRAAAPPDDTVRYGPGPEQVASVWRPRVGALGTAPVVMFLHGGFWRAAYDRTHVGPLAVALAEAGFLVCAPEYRRTGAGGGMDGGWPGTFDDVAAAVDGLPGILSDLGGPPVSAGLVLGGHSAGGHLALWAAARHRLPAGSPWRVGPGLAPGEGPGLATGRGPGLATAGGPIRAVVALAAVSELGAAYEQGLGNGAAGALMGGSPAEHPDRYARADPAGLLPIGVPLRVLHGSRDDVVPAAMSRSFAARARAAGDEVAWQELQGCDHFDVIDPLSVAWGPVRAAFGA
jgi:acetyl esterase/lipase